MKTKDEIKIAIKVAFEKYKIETDNSNYALFPYHILAFTECVIKQLALTGVVQVCECKCEFPIIRTGTTEYCSICQLEVK